MKILITGCAGYIGSMLTTSLLNKGYCVIGVDNFFYNNKQSILHLLGHDNFQFFKYDVNSEKMDNLYSQADIIIPLAALVGEHITYIFPRLTQAVNYESIYNMIEILSSSQRVIFPNTNSGYGNIGINTQCYENTPMHPISIYGKSKCDAETALLDSHLKNVVSLRLATVCGISPRPRFDLLVNDFALRLCNGGELQIYEPEYMRNYIHIKDVVRCFEHIINEKITSGVFNVGDLNISKRKLAERICNYYQISREKISVREGKDPDQRNYVINTDKLKHTGFHLKYRLEDALEEIQRFCNIFNYDQTKYMRNVL